MRHVHEVQIAGGIEAWALRRASRRIGAGCHASTFVLPGWCPEPARAGGWRPPRGLVSAAAASMTAAASGSHAPSEMAWPAARTPARRRRRRRRLLRVRKGEPIHGHLPDVGTEKGFRCADGREPPEATGRTAGAREIRAWTGALPLRGERVIEFSHMVTGPTCRGPILADPGGLDRSSTGVGSSQHLALGSLDRMAGIRIGHVPYKDAPASQNDLRSGRIVMTFATPTTAIPLHGGERHARHRPRRNRAA